MKSVLELDNGDVDVEDDDDGDVVVCADAEHNPMCRLHGGGGVMSSYHF